MRDGRDASRARQEAGLACATGGAPRVRDGRRASSVRREARLWRHAAAGGRARLTAGTSELRALKADFHHRRASAVAQPASGDAGAADESTPTGPRPRRRSHSRRRGCRTPGWQQHAAAVERLTRAAASRASAAAATASEARSGASARSSDASARSRAAQNPLSVQSHHKLHHKFSKIFKTAQRTYLIEMVHIESRQGNFLAEV